MIRAYLFDRREGFLQRWHSEYTTRKESLAEHQWFVTRNALLICDSLREFEIAYPDKEACMRMAMFHDEAEIMTGDASGVAKREWPEIKVAMDSAENSAIETMWDGLPSTMRTYMSYPMKRYKAFREDDIEAQIVKYCDVLDAHIFAVTERLAGNTYLEDAEYRTTQWMLALDWHWLHELRIKMVECP